MYLFLLFVFMFSLPLALSCESQIKIYNKTLFLDVPTKCETDQDCALADLNWNPCSGLYSFAKDSFDSSSVLGLQAFRQMEHKQCAFVSPTCATAPQAQAYCFEKTCDITIAMAGTSGDEKTAKDDSHDSLKVEIGKVDDAFPLVLVNRKTKSVISNTSFDLITKETIYCATAPCPQPGPRTHRLTSDQNGVVILHSNILSADNQISIQKFLVRSFRHDQLLGLKGRKVGFDSN